MPLNFDLETYLPLWLNVVAPALTAGTFIALMRNTRRERYVGYALAYLVADTVAISLVLYGSSLNISFSPDRWTPGPNFFVIPISINHDLTDQVLNKTSVAFWLLSAGASVLILTLWPAVLRAASFHLARRTLSVLLTRVLSDAGAALLAAYASVLTYESLTGPYRVENALVLIVGCVFLDLKLLWYVLKDVLRVVMIGEDGATDRVEPEARPLSPRARQIASNLGGLGIAVVLIFLTVAFSPINEPHDFTVHKNQLLIVFLAVPLLILLAKLFDLAFLGYVAIYFLVDTVAFCLVLYGGDLNLYTDPTHLDMDYGFVLNLPFSLKATGTDLVPKATAMYWLDIVLISSVFITLPGAVLNAARLHWKNRFTALVLPVLAKAGAYLVGFFTAAIALSSLTFAAPSQNLGLLVLGTLVIVMAPFRDFRQEVAGGVGLLNGAGTAKRVVELWRSIMRWVSRPQRSL